MPNLERWGLGPFILRAFLMWSNQMSRDPAKPNAFQQTMLTRAQAVTHEQLECAKDLVQSSLGATLTPNEQKSYAVQLAQVLATNYLAETLNSKIGK